MKKRFLPLIALAAAWALLVVGVGFFIVGDEFHAHTLERLGIALSEGLDIRSAGAMPPTVGEQALDDYANALIHCSSFGVLHQRIGWGLSALLNVVLLLALGGRMRRRRTDAPPRAENAEAAAMNENAFFFSGDCGMGHVDVPRGPFKGDPRAVLQRFARLSPQPVAPSPSEDAPSEGR